MTDETNFKKWELDLAEATREAREAVQERDQAERRARRALARQDALAKIVDGLRALAASEDVPQKERLPDVSETATVWAGITALGAGETMNGKVPRGRQAIVRVLSEFDRAWGIRDLSDEIEKRGWIKPGARNTRAAVGVALKRLVDEGRVERVGYGSYRIPQISGVTTLDEGSSAATELETHDNAKEG